MNIELDDNLRTQKISDTVVEYKLTEGTIYQVLAHDGESDRILMINDDVHEDSSTQVWIKWDDKKKPDTKAYYSAAVGQQVVMISAEEKGRAEKESNLWLFNKDTQEKCFVYTSETKRTRIFAADRKGNPVKVTFELGADKKAVPTIQVLAEKLHTFNGISGTLVLGILIGFPVVSVIWYFIERKAGAPWWGFLPVAGIAGFLGFLATGIVGKILSIPGEMINQQKLIEHSEKIKARLLNMNE